MEDHIVLIIEVNIEIATFEAANHFSFIKTNLGQECYVISERNVMSSSQAKSEDFEIRRESHCPIAISWLRLGLCFKSIT